MDIMPDKKSIHASASPFWEAALIFIIAFLIRLIGNGDVPVHTDELYHFLASQSWLETGYFRILDGQYSRAGLFTALVSLSNAIFGMNNIFFARIPSLLAGAVLVSAVFVWLCHATDRKVAWICALLFCFAQYAILISQFARFYTLHALLIWLGSVSIYSVIINGKTRNYVWLITFAVVAFAIAWHLQITTAISLMAICIWGVLDVLCRPDSRQSMILKKYWLWCVLAVCLTVVFLHTHLENILNQFFYSVVWAQDSSNYILFYYRDFTANMPIFWLLFPLALLAALMQWPRPALFCAVMFTVPLMTHSFGGMKSTRYIFYAMPYFFALWAMAVPAFFIAIRGFIREVISQFESRFSLQFSNALLSRLSIGFVLFLAVTLTLGNRIYFNTFKDIKYELVKILHNPYSLFDEPLDPPWSGQTTALRNSIGEPAILVTADDVRTIAYLRRHDLLLNATILSDVATWKDFAMDFRTGRPVIASADAMKKVIGCYPDGAILVPESRWRVVSGVTPEVADLIEQMAVASLPVEGFRIYKWTNTSTPDICVNFRRSMKGSVHGQ